MYTLKMLDRSSNQWLNLINCETIEVAKLYKNAFKKLNDKLIIIITMEVSK